jgi:anaerobic selenocysteine-containing dehydrogenase
VTALIECEKRGIEALVDDLKCTQWPDIKRQSGLTREDLEYSAKVYMKSERAILVYGMGSLSTGAVRRTCSNWPILRCFAEASDAKAPGCVRFAAIPTCRAIELSVSRKFPKRIFPNRLKQCFGFKPPAALGHNVVTALEAMIRGDVTVFFAMGDNFAAAIPDWRATRAALRILELTVHVSTKLSRSHLIHGRNALILPCLGQTEIDIQTTGPQSITVEASMSMVHALNRP